MHEKQISHYEQEIYFSLKEGGIYDIDFIRQLVKMKRETLLVLLSRMQKKGWITRLKKGMYVVNSPNSTQLNDPFLAALRIFGGYLGFSSALYIYNLTDEQISTIYVCTLNKSGKRIMGDITINAIRLGRRATGMTFLNGYFVSSKPKTLYDCFYKPELSGWYSNILAAVNRLKLSDSDWDMFLFYVRKFGNSGFSRKVGFLLELLKNKVGTDIPGSVIQKLNTSGSVVKLGLGRNGKFIKKWNVVNYIDEGDLLGKILWKR